MAVKSNITTPLRKETYKNLQLNAGLALVNFDMSSYTTADALKTAIATAIQDESKMLGATRGGGTCTITREIRQVEADGVRSRFKGSEIVDSADAYLSTTFIEITPEHLKNVLGNVDIDDTIPGHVVMTMRTAFNDGDYLDNIVWIGDTSEGFMAIELLNALNTADFTFTFADKNEGTANAEFHAHQEDVSSNEELPVKFHFFEPSGSLGNINVTSVAGTNTGYTKITVDTATASGQKYVYKFGTVSAPPSLAYHEKADYTWTEWDGTSDIYAGDYEDGTFIKIAIVDAYGRAIKSGAELVSIK